MADQFSSMADTLISSARKLKAITPNDGAELADVTKAIYVGGAGTLLIIAVGDTEAVSLTVLAGAVLPIRVKKVMSTGTTATGIVALL